MRIKLAVLLFVFSFSLFGQFKLKQLEPCKDLSGNRLDSCFTMTDVYGFQYYISIDDLINIVNTNTGFNCDSVSNCLISGGALCNALGQFPTGIPTINDYVFAKNGSNCKKILLDSIVSSTNLCSKLGFPVTTISNSDYFLIKKANGDCRRVLASGIVGNVNCDSVESCLANGSLCDVLKTFSNGVPATGDSIIFIKNGTCRKGLINSLITGGYNCDSVKACIGGGTWFCDSIEACLNNGSLCTALRQFPSGSFQNGDSIYFSHNGVCRRGLIDDLISGATFNCDSVQACLSDGALCDAIGDLDVDGGGSTWYLLGRSSDGDCARIPWDSVNQACTMEIEVGDFGGNPDGCSFASSCDGGNTHTNQHWVFPVVNGTDLEIWGGSEGNPDCLMSSVGLPVPTVSATSTCNGNGWPELKFDFSYAGTTTSVNLGELKLVVTNGNRIHLALNGNTCNGFVTECCTPMMAPEPMQQTAPSHPTINQVDYTKLKRYKSHSQADSDNTLPHGGLYLVGNYRSIQVKP